jgi:transposase
VLDEAKRERLRAIVHESPRSFGKPTRLWTLRLLAEVCFEQGVTSRVLSIESMRRAFKRMGVAWKRAKHWITSPDPRYALKKSSATG